MTTFPITIDQRTFADADALAAWLRDIAHTPAQPRAMWPSEPLLALGEPYETALDEAAMRLLGSADPDVFRMALHLGRSSAFYDALLDRLEADPLLPDEAASALVAWPVASDAPRAARAVAWLLAQDRWGKVFALLGRADPGHLLLPTFQACAARGGLEAVDVGITGAALAADEPDALPAAAAAIAKAPHFHARFREAIRDARPDLPRELWAAVEAALGER